MIPDHSHKTLAELLDLSGRRVVVTGGAKGIGAQTAHRLAEAGADVVIADLDLSAATATATDIANATGRTTVAAFIDVGDTASIVAAADVAVSRLGGIDIWVNNAGIYPTTGPAIEATDEFIDRMSFADIKTIGEALSKAAEEQEKNATAPANRATRRKAKA